MKRVAILAGAAAAVLVTLTPASAQWRDDARYGRALNGHGGDYGSGWDSRRVSSTDPSFGNQSGINAARRTGRCVTDLGYGRYEYCGW